MCLLLKKRFVRPLKMLYRYKSKWYMPPKTKQEYGKHRAALLNKDLTKFLKKERKRLIKNKNVPTSKLENKVNINYINLTNKLTLFKQKQNIKKKHYARLKSAKESLNLNKKKELLKQHIKYLLSPKTNSNTMINNLTELNDAILLLKRYQYQTVLLKKRPFLTKKINYKKNALRTLKKRIRNGVSFAINFFSSYVPMQKNIIAPTLLLNKEKKMLKLKKLLHYIKMKESLGLYSIKEKETYAYNYDLFDANFIEKNIRINWGMVPAKNLSDYFITRITNKLINKIDNAKLTGKANLLARLKLKIKVKKNKYKKIKDRTFMRKKRINFAEKTYNRFNFSDVKNKLSIKWKRNNFSFINITHKTNGFINKGINEIENYFNSQSFFLRKKKIKLGFLSSINIINKLKKQILVKSKTGIRIIARSQFRILVNLLKFELKKNSKKIKKITRKINLYKRRKDIKSRKKKIDLLSFRDLFIRENQQLREEIKSFRYIWKNSSMYNYDSDKQNKLNLLLLFRKYKKNLLKVLNNYPEGFDAFKSRLKTGQYYTGFSLLKRKL